MKIVFLDMDGVVNSAAFYENRFVKAEPGVVAGHPLYRANHIDPGLVALLNELLTRSGAVCVLSSTWRLLFGIKYTLPALRARGFTGEIVAVTPDTAQKVGALHVGHERGHEIQEWLDAHPEVTDFIILDDSADMAHLAPRLVRTSWQRGLEREHVERAVKMLGGSHAGT